jgi:hypothetical protein
MNKRLMVTVVLAVVMVLGVAGVALAQTGTPTATPAPNAKAFAGKWMDGVSGFFGRMAGTGNNWKQFDTIASVLKLTPAQLFEQLHGGKTLAEIATAQGVDQSAISDALKSERKTALQSGIDQALKSGKLTQEQADWLRQGIDKGWLPGGRMMGGGLPGRKMMGGFGHGLGRMAPRTAPTATPGAY